MATEKILVTGGTGFVGSNLVMALLRKRYDVRCLVRKNSRARFLSKMGIALAFGDLTDPASLTEAVKDVSVVFHLAGILGKWGIPNYLYSNIHAWGTRKILSTCIAQGVSRFIYCSTSGVLGPIRDPPASESAPRGNDIRHEVKD